MGPFSSGKTALIKQLFAPSQPSSSGSTEEGSTAELSTVFGSYLDGRLQQLTRSADLASSLQAHGKSLFERITDLAKLAGLGVAEAAVDGVNFNLEPVVKMVFEQEGKQSSLTRVIAGYTSMLRQFSRLKESSRSKMPWPIFCIDEANVLTEWGGSEGQQRDLRSLLRFFVRVSLQVQCSKVLINVCFPTS